MMTRGFDGKYVISQFSGAFGPLMIVFMVFKLAIFALVIFFIYKAIKKHKFQSISALRILNERYAKGEIEEEEYLKRKEVLRRN